MARFDNETITKYGKRIARALGVVIKCDEFGRNWSRENKDCKLCRIDSQRYNTKCREFSLGIKTGYKPTKIGRPRKKLKLKQKEIYKVKGKKNSYQLFKKGTKIRTVYDFLKDESNIGKLELIMKHVAETFECDTTSGSIVQLIAYIRKALSEFGHEEIKYYGGVYYLTKTRQGNRYDNIKPKRKECTEIVNNVKEEHLQHLKA
ncbi:MAG: hypothetical protein CMH64_03020 [Nanoarchaeota archaeon]|jgi:hypothetical protein|nr:hypothetical protein [Nanoarchaeota archaeon]|tara:strand:- start:340 stop:951 length:612 start_codon:yes stop_codon:yes gene_type:complete